jgi:hypothetical protein
LNLEGPDVAFSRATALDQAAEITRLERLAAATQDNAERTTLMELLAAEHDALDQLATGTSEKESEARVIVT